MSKRAKSQLLLVIAGVFVGVLIWIAPRNESVDQNIDVKENVTTSHDHSEDDGHDHGIEIEGIDPLVLAKFDQLENEIAASSDVDQKLKYYDSLILWSKKNTLPPRVATYTRKKAELVPTESNWFLAGDNYFKAFRLSKNQSAPMLKGAIAAYEEVLKLNSENLNAKTAIGVAYVEGAAALNEMPMKGIGILKEVLNKDPKNINALTNLGYFAIQSGQFEKAIERFNTVLSIDSSNAEAYLYLTDIYLSQNQKDKGIETLEKYKSLISDPLVIQQVDAYIEEIKNK